MKFLKRFGLYLFPSLFQGALSFFMLRWTTRVLDPGDFGAFALLTSLTGLGSALASLGSNYLIYSHFPGLSLEERRSFLSTLFWGASAVMACFCAAFLALWTLLSAHFAALASIPHGAVGLSLCTLAVSLPWWFAMDITVLEGRSRTFAIVTLCYSTVTAGVTLAGLYLLHWGMISLFASSLAGGMVYAIGGLYCLMPYLRWHWSRAWMAEMLKLGPVASLGNFSESFQTAMERSLLALHAGLGPLGLYNFSQQFRQLAFMMVKAATRSIWPITIQENREGESLFRKTAAAWSVMHLTIAMAGVFFATMGSEVTAFLSHGKFLGSEKIIAIWMVYLLVKHTGRAQLGFLTVMKENRFLATLSLCCVGIGILLLFALVPRFGIAGAVAALFTQDTAYRIGSGWRARRLRRFPFQDHWALAGIGLTLALLGGVVWWHPGFAARLCLFVGGEAVLAIFAGTHVAKLRALGLLNLPGRKSPRPS